jgi:amidase
MKRATFLILTLLVWCPALGARTIDLDAATIADIDAAFKAGTLTAERLVQLCLTRIGSYDREGPSLHAVMILNPNAIETARELDAERKVKGPRSALHGVPVVLKDNYNTADLPTTGAVMG